MPFPDDRRQLRNALPFLGLVSSAELNCFPDFLVIAPPKTATTWLFRQFSRDGRIFVPPAKEVKYFNYLRKFRNLNWYLSVFQDGAGRLKGDLSPEYSLLTRSTIQLIHALRPDLKLIFLMRDPVERAWSHVRMNFRQQTSTFDGCDLKIDEITDDMWRRSFADQITVLFGDYFGQLQRWLEVFDRSQVFVEFTENLTRSPRESLNAVETFLGLEPSVDIDQSCLNERVNVGSPWILKSELRECLFRIYGSRTRELAEYLGREFGQGLPVEWNDTLSAGSSASALQSAQDADCHDLCRRLAKTIDDDQLEKLLEREERHNPREMETYRDWRIVQFRSRFYGIPPYSGAIDFFDRAQLAHPGILAAATADELKQGIDRAAGDDSWELGDEPAYSSVPVLVKEGYRSFNLVHFHGKCYALAQSLGVVDLASVDGDWIETGRRAHCVLVGDSTLDVKRLVDELPGG